MSADLLLLRCPSCRALNRVKQDRLQSVAICGKCKSPLDYPRKPVEATSTTFDREVLDWPGVAVVDFWAPWCAPCRFVAPVLEDLASRRAGKLKVIKVNTEEQPALASRFRIQAIPTLILYRNGKQVDQVAGALSGTELERWIDVAVTP
jgi:thioredoxin 2